MPCRDHRWNHHVTPSNQLFLVILSLSSEILRIKGNLDRLKFKVFQSLHTIIGLTVSS